MNTKTPNPRLANHPLGGEKVKRKKTGLAGICRPLSGGRCQQTYLINMMASFAYILNSETLSTASLSCRRPTSCQIFHVVSQRCEVFQSDCFLYVVSRYVVFQNTAGVLHVFYY